MLPWLYYRPAATALIPPLAWEPPYAKGVSLKTKTTHTKRLWKTECPSSNVLGLRAWCCLHIHPQEGAGMLRRQPRGLWGYCREDRGGRARTSIWCLGGMDPTRPSGWLDGVSKYILMPLNSSSEWYHNSIFPEYVSNIKKNRSVSWPPGGMLVYQN